MQERTPLLIFDGECGFCAASASWAARGWHNRARSVAWQDMGESGLSAVGLTVKEAQEAAWWIDGSGRTFRGYRAIGKALLAGRGGRRAAGAVVLTPPFSWLAAGLYQVVVRYRHRLPGGTPACGVKEPS